MEANVYQHFRKDEHPFIDSVERWVAKVETEYAPFLSGFLDPRQRFILETVLKTQSDSIKVTFFGGYEQAERQRALLYPDYYEPEEADFQVIVDDIMYPKKFTELKHGQILGTLINLGIKRELFGDITTDGDNWQIFLDEKMASYVANQVEKIGKVKVSLVENKGHRIVPMNEWLFESLTASSQRLDAIISEVFNISRQRSKDLTESGKVKVNFVECYRPDTVIEVWDLISVRGFGRIRLDSIEGVTKKDKIRFNISTIKHKR